MVDEDNYPKIIIIDLNGCENYEARTAIQKPKLIGQDLIPK